MNTNRWEELAGQVRASLAAQGIKVPGTAGRPIVGTAIHIRLPDPLLADVDRLAATSNISRAETIRILVQVSVNQLRREGALS